MLTLDELNKRLERDQELFDRLTAERETIRIRIYRYKKRIDFMEQLRDMEDEEIDSIFDSSD